MHRWENIPVELPRLSSASFGSLSAAHTTGSGLQLRSFTPKLGKLKARGPAIHISISLPNVQVQFKVQGEIRF